MPGVPVPLAVDQVSVALDPVLGPLGFAGGQAGAAATEGQVVFCRGAAGSIDGGCLDLVVDLAATPAWRIVDVRWWGYESDRWHLPYATDAELAEQLAGLVRTLPAELA